MRKCDMYEVVVDDVCVIYTSSRTKAKQCIDVLLETYRPDQICVDHGGRYGDVRSNIHLLI